MILESKKFQSLGYVQMTFEENELIPIKEEIDSILNNEEYYNSRKLNHTLAGHVKKEFGLFDCRRYVENLISPGLEYFKNEIGDPKFTKHILTKNCPYVLDSLWTNIQEKYEFNPLHNHSGVFSFVIWLKSPFEAKKEREFFTDINEEEKRNGCFSLVYIDQFGLLECHNIFVDKNWENKAIIFPSMLNHIVYPFYTSDDQRISVSGNFKYGV